MAAHHHDFIFQLGIGAGNFGDGVEAMLVVAGELHVDIHFDADWHIGFEQAIHASVVFDCGHNHGYGISLIAFVIGSAQAAVVKDGAAGAAAVAAVAAGKNDGQDMLRGQKFSGFVHERPPL